MRLVGRFGLILTLAIGCMAAGAADAPAVTAFVDVNVVPMDRNRVLRHQTVLVRGDRIESLGPANRATVPTGVRRIEGHGTAYLVPGLADMHVHVETGEDATLYVAAGVTTILHMGGGRFNTISVPGLRALIANELAPQVFFAMMIEHQPPLSGGWPITSVDDARLAVRAAKSMQFDFVKMYNLPTSDEFDAIVDEARQQHLAVIGHGVRSVGLPAGLCRGQVMAAHAEEFLYTVFENRPQYDRIDEVAAETRRCGGYVTANLSTFQAIERQWGRPEERARMFTDPRLHTMSPAARLGWTVPDRDYSRREGTQFAESLKFLRVFVGALSRHGVPLLAGTDTPVVPGEIPGAALHDELETLLDSGLNNFAALSAATRVPGEFITTYVPGAQRFGVIAPGTRADLLLVAGNPLESLHTLRAPIGVMTRGRWHPAEALAAAVERNRAASDAQLQTAEGR